MAFFKRVFSADYRRALAAEAAGEYAEAARAYALAGERHKVAEMHLLISDRAGGPDARLAELRAGVRWAEGDRDEDRAVRRRIARAMLTLVRSVGVLGESDRAVLREAAVMASATEDWATAGECHELAGDELQAAECYQKAGEVERLESVLGREEKRRRRDTELREGFEDYQLRYASGERDAALAALRRCIAVAPGGEHARLLETLELKRIAGARVTLREGDQRTTYVGAFPVGMGREASCEVVLRDAGISRRHAEILELGGRFRLRDCRSKNGTRLAGCAVDPDGELPLEREGEIGLGDLCAIRFRVDGAALELEVARGLVRGLRVVASGGPIAVAGGELRFADGRPMLTAARTVLLNGARAGARVQLVRGDVVSIGGARFEVEG